MQWLLEHEEVTSADSGFVWRYLTDVRNWNDPPASFVLHGPFESGTRGATQFPESEPLNWVLRDVRRGESYTMDSDLDGAVLSCEWSFQAVTGGGTRLRQRIGVTGASAEDKAAGIQEAFGATLPDGMKRIARLLADAAKEQAG